MNTVLTNCFSDICDDFEGVDGLVTLVGGDIFIDEEQFGYYHAAWMSEAHDQIDIVVHAIVGTADQISLSVVQSYLVKEKRFVSNNRNSLYSDPEWLNQANVVSEKEINAYSKAMIAKKLANDILENDVNIRGAART